MKEPEQGATVITCKPSVAKDVNFTALQKQVSKVSALLIINGGLFSKNIKIHLKLFMSEHSLQRVNRSKGIFSLYTNLCKLFVVLDSTPFWC